MQDFLVTSLYDSYSLGGNKASMYTHIHTNPGGRLVIICNHQADSPLYVQPDV